MLDASFGKAIVGALWLAAVIIAVTSLVLGILIGWWLI